MLEITPGALLKTINSPADLKKLDREQLQQVADELRHHIIDVVSVYGDHFGASFGVECLAYPTQCC
jgi:1-deoxy-D-xylulose-5-phosphate synthase